jgi:membrane-bound lytic murein transglycosylase A
VSPWALPAFTDDLDAESLRAVLDRTRPGDPAAETAAARLLAVVEGSPDAGARRTAIARAFRVVRVREPLLLTAYYEPELEARLTPDAEYRHPLYARPPDLLDVDPRALDPECSCRRSSGRVLDGRVAPYFTRGEIDAGALDRRGLELAWTRDPLALFFLHIQGSGRLRLPDGRRVGVHFAGTNGRPYRSLARAMVERGLLPRDRTSVPDMRRALAMLPPERQAETLAANERYVFFRLGSGGVRGSLGVELTPGRSIATDPALVRTGSLAYLDTPSARRFVVSQDTGAAIRGARADLFLGAGAEAEARAGRTRERGALYVLVPRS